MDDRHYFSAVLLMLGCNIYRTIINIIPALSTRTIFILMYHHAENNRAVRVLITQYYMVLTIEIELDLFICVSKLEIACLFTL